MNPYTMLGAVPVAITDAIDELSADVTTIIGVALAVGILVFGTAYLVRVFKKLAK